MSKIDSTDDSSNSICSFIQSVAYSISENNSIYNQSEDKSLNDLNGILSEISEVSSSSDYSSSESFNFSNFKEKRISYNSNLNLKHFCLSFLWISQKMKIAKTHRDLLLKFIKNLINNGDNFIPNSYNNLIASTIGQNIKVKLQKNCKFCQRKVEENDCSYKDWRKPETLNLSSFTFDSIIFDLKLQLVQILEANWIEIKNYKGKLHS